MCKLTRYEGSKTIEAWQCRVSGYVPAPMTVLRRFDCVLAASKAKVLAEHARLKGSKVEGEALDQRLNKAAGQRFHNHSPLDFERLKGDPDNIEKHILPSFGSGHEPGDWLGTGPRPNKGQQRESRHRVSPSCNVHGSTASLRAPNPKQSRWHSRSSTRNSTSSRPLDSSKHCTHGSRAWISTTPCSSSNSGVPQSSSELARATFDTSSWREPCIRGVRNTAPLRRLAVRVVPGSSG